MLVKLGGTENSLIIKSHFYMHIHSNFQIISKKEQYVANVLLIEDDIETAEEIVLELERFGHSVMFVDNGTNGLDAARGDYDVLIIDRLLPGLEGLDIIRQIRQEGIRTPAIIVSALGRLDDRVRGLRAGGDDYLAKPFALIELIARLDAMLRRPVEARETYLRLGPLEIDLLNRRASRSSRRLDLQAKEFELLEYFLRRPGHIVTKSMLLRDVWGYRFEPRSNVVDVHMSKLRRKVDLPEETPLFRNVRGQGYRLDELR